MLVFVRVIMSTKSKNNIHIFAHVCVCVCLQSHYQQCVCMWLHRPNSILLNSTNRIHVCGFFVCVCIHACACLHMRVRLPMCEKVRDSRESVQRSAKDNKKFLLDRGASHESGVIPAFALQQRAKTNTPKVEQLQPRSENRKLIKHCSPTRLLSGSVEVVTEVSLLSQRNASRSHRPIHTVNVNACSSSQDREHWTCQFDRDGRSNQSPYSVLYFTSCSMLFSFMG